MTRDEQILTSMARLFRAFPANGKVDADTIRDYCEAVQRFPVGLISRVVEDFRLGMIERNKMFAPSISELVSVLRRSPMNVGEQAEYRQVKAALEAKRERLALVKS